MLESWKLIVSLFIEVFLPDLMIVCGLCVMVLMILIVELNYGIV